MTREEYIRLFHKAQVNLVAFKQVFHCDEELRRMVEMAVEAEREACAKVCEDGINNATDWDSSAWDQACENRAYAIRAKGNT